MRDFVLHILAVVQGSLSPVDDLLQFVEMNTFGSVSTISLLAPQSDVAEHKEKLQQKALQQPKQKKSKSAEFLMGKKEERAAAVGIENPAFNGGGSAKLSGPPVWLGREIRGDRPDSTLAAHPKKMELQAPAKERGDEHAQNYFDPSSAQQTDPRHCRMAGVSTEDELELTILNADENRLYQRMTALLDEDNTFIDIPGTLQASRDEEVLEVKTGDPVLQWRLLLHGGGHALGFRHSQAHTIAKTQDEASAGLGGEAGLETVTGRESTVKMKIAEEVIPHYTQQLRERVQPDMITLGSLSLQQQVAQKEPLKRREWAKGKKKLLAFFTGNVKEQHSQRDSDKAEGEAPLPRLLQCSRTIESPSLRALGEGQEEAMAKYDQMTELPESSSSATRPMWQVNQSTAPQPVEVCVCCLRATRDKLPRGLYTVSVALYSCLGGSAIAWCSKKEQQQWSVSIEPIEHLGRFHDTDLHVNQNLFMILPAACEVVPSMVLIFQLIALRGDSSHISSVLAWGAFPVCGSGLGLVQGRFKIPLLRGEPNTQLDQFKKIERLILFDLDHWLCNMYFQVKRLPSGVSRGPECDITVLIPPANPPVMPQPEVHYDQPQSQLQPQPPSQSQFCPQPIHHQLHLYPQQQPHAGPSSRAGEPAVVYSHRGSPLHLSADSACSSSSVPGKNSSSGAISGNIGAKGDPCRVKAEGRIHYKKKPIKKTNSCGPSMSSSSAPPRQADKQKMQPSMENLSTEELEEYTFSLQSALTGPGSHTSCLSERVRLALRMLPFDMDLLLLGQQQHTSWRGSVRQLGLIMLLMALMWFVRLYLHYCSQWLYLQAIAVPVNKFHFHAHTVELVYQSSLLHIWEELAMLVVGPLTLNALTFLLVLIRWGCQQIFGSLPSFMSKFIMAQGVWTVLDPLAVFAVDAVLGHLTYSPDMPVGDAAKLYWHFYRADQSGAMGVIITVFLYVILFLLSITILFVYILRFHNDGHMLDIFQRLTAKEGTYFLPQDMELSNQELSFIVKKAEQWRGFNGERRKVVVYDYIWTAEDPLPGSAAPSDPLMEGAPLPEGETSTHVIVYTLYMSGLKQRYRHFLRQSDGAIIEVIGDMEGLHNASRMVPCPRQGSANQKEGKEGASAPQQLRKRKRLFGRHHRVEPVGGSGCGSSFALQDLNQ
ncbi:uncharacterized protein ofcc1 [Toxotes jaculatrix]|uniref:uncharacterized protein ofcc1 n=1 Tax=Toxotes jaculatrix TaxID=941984 RepID=UPI001B3AF093|nr:uncharacterized protein ofcc1 [Toxotes jaculatrix]